MRQNSYAIVPFSRIYVTPIWSFSLFLDLINLCFLFAPAQVSAEQKDLGDSAMGDGEKTCPCCQFYGIPCRQARATEDEATTRRNQRLFSGSKRKRSHQEQLAEDSLFIDSPSVEELQAIQKRKNHKCSRDTQVENQ